MPNVLMLDFLADLRENNSLDWMHAHKKRKKEAQNAFLELVQGCIADLAETEPCLAALDAKDLAFRINRDTRFSDDKSPYNPTFRAHISPAGRMPVPVGYFVSVTPGGSFAGGGLFAPHFKDATRMVRDRIAADPMFGMTREEILSHLDPSAYIGRCPAQVDDFLKLEVHPRIDKYLGGSQIEVEINL